MGRPIQPLPENFAFVYGQWKAGQISGKQAAKACGMPETTFRYKVASYEKEYGANAALGAAASPAPAPQKDASREDALREDAPQEDALREDAPQEDALREDALQEDAPQEDASREDAPQEAASQEDALQAGSTSSNKTAAKNARGAPRRKNFAGIG